MTFCKRKMTYCESRLRELPQHQGNIANGNYQLMSKLHITIISSVIVVNVEMSDKAGLVNNETSEVHAGGQDFL